MISVVDPKKLWPTETRQNTRYKTLSHLTFFTAGDEDQFFCSKSSKNGRDTPVTLPKENIWGDTININFPFTQSATATINTFRYLFNKFKKGIFVKIIDNRVETFLPFSKNRFINSWSHLIQFDPARFKTMNDFMRTISDQTAAANGKHYRFNPKSVSPESEWYANNCLLRYENPIREADTNIAVIRHLLDELCANRAIPDIEFFINRRDFPLLMKDGVSEPYFHIFGDHPMEETFQQSVKEGMAPIFSMCSSARFADIAIPTHEDWARVESTEREQSLLFPPSSKQYPREFNVPWSQRAPTAVFRGGSTGCGVSSSGTHINQRLLVAKLSVQDQPDKYGVPLLDAGITKWNLRPRKIEGEKFLQTINFADEAPKVAPLTPEEQATYKYLINIDGHVSAFRLSLEMNMGCCILLVDSQYGWKMWFFDKLIAYTHYVPVKADLSDLIQQIQWCRENDDQCSQIADNARQFYKEWLSRDSILDYLQSTIIKVRLDSPCVMYRKDPVELQHLTQRCALQQILESSPDPYKLSRRAPRMPRPKIAYSLNSNPGRSSYGSSKALGLYLKYLNRTLQLPDTRHAEALFKNKKSDIRVTEIDGQSVVLKSSITQDGVLEHVNEAFISEVCLNDLISQVPHFAMSYTATVSEESVVLYNEYISGTTLSQLIKEKFFASESVAYPKKSIEQIAIKRFLEIMFQMMLALQVAQDQCGFIHKDLAPWNIIVQKLEKGNPKTLMYDIGLDIYKIITMFIPVIIDYGKSHVIASPSSSQEHTRHFGIVSMFEVSWVEDVFSFVVLSCIELDQYKLIGETPLCNMLNFFLKKEHRLRSYKEALSFLRKFRSYNDRISAFSGINDEIDLAPKRPLDFIKWCHDAGVLAPLNNTFGKEGKEGTKETSRNKRLYMDIGNPRQLFDEAFLEPGDHSSYLAVVERLYRSTLPQPNTRLELLLVSQTLLTVLENTLDDYKASKLSNIDTTVFRKAIKFIRGLYAELLSNKEPDVWTIEQPGDPVSFKISRDVLMDIRATPNTPSKPTEDLSFFKNIALRVLRWRSSLAEDKIFEADACLLDELAPVLDSSLESKKTAADRNTLFTYLTLSNCH